VSKKLERTASEKTDRRPNSGSSAQNPKRGKKKNPRGTKNFLGPKVTTPQIWGSAEISAGLSVFLKICSCQLFFKKNFSHFLLLFFLIFFQKWSKSKGQ